MGKQSKGRCHYCQAEYTKSGMIKHVAACKERVKEMKKASVKTCGYFTLSITGKYNGDYWLIVECRENATLQDVDQFLRDIWLECCGHLSAFEIEGESYDCAPDAMEFWDEPAKNMKYQLKSVIEKGMNIGYEYDFGSTTELIITVSDYRVGAWKKDKLTILSRNNPIEYICSECGKKTAISICAECIYEGTGFLCEDCEESHECGTDMLMPVCNSPRCGVCGYTGSDMYED
ncbi:MAG: IS1096 element passenger TnpR family protein [Lachnospiraceae bacterium]